MRPDLPNSQQPMSDDEHTTERGRSGAPTGRSETPRRTPARVSCIFILRGVPCPSIG